MTAAPWDGHLARPGEALCSRCLAPLNPNGHRPAETYAGTATGLCYSCEKAPAFSTSKRLVSGATYWSHPPCSPSHRRDRQEFLSFDDCPNAAAPGSITTYSTRCDHGRVWVSRADSQGGSYTVSCNVCRARHEAHPAVREQDLAAALLVKVTGIWKQRGLNEHTKRCKAAGVDRDDLDTPGDPARIASEVRAVCMPLEPALGATEAPTFPKGWAKLTKTQERDIENRYQDTVSQINDRATGAHGIAWAAKEIA